MTNLYLELSVGISQKKKIKINPFNLVRKMKEMRRMLVENILQYQLVYAFIYMFINEYYTDS